MTPTFQFFEDVCKELAFSDEVVLPEDTFLSEELLRDLQDEYSELAPEAAVPRALKALEEHFKARGSNLPFSYDLPTRSFSATDKPYLSFVSNATGMRGVRNQSRAFELATTHRLAKRGLGGFHRVGWPRSKNGKLKPFNAYLKTLGFNNKVAFGNEKDGGFDILWLLPLGAIPHRPLISFQCKNGSYDLTEAFKSNGATQMSLGCHKGLQASVHTLCVVFNDYIEDRMLSPKPFAFVPLGLSDLAGPFVPFTTIATL
jgi:hypothetical protein